MGIVHLNLDKSAMILIEMDLIAYPVHEVLSNFFPSLRSSLINNEVPWSGFYQLVIL